MQRKKKLYFLKVWTKDVALQYNWSNPAVTKGAAPAPPSVQAKLPPFAGLVLSLNQVMERQKSHTPMVWGLN